MKKNNKIVKKIVAFAMAFVITLELPTVAAYAAISYKYTDQKMSLLGSSSATSTSSTGYIKSNSTSYASLYVASGPTSSSQVTFYLVNGDGDRVTDSARGTSSGETFKLTYRSSSYAVSGKKYYLYACWPTGSYARVLTIKYSITP